MTLDRTNLDRLMTELGMENHQLATKAGTSRQAIYKLRKGITRMLPDWAMRLAPHLGVSWQALVDGSATPADPMRDDLLAAYAALNDEQRRALLAMIKVMVPDVKVPDPSPGDAPRPKRQPAA